MENASTVKQVSKIEHVGPYQIQTTAQKSVNFSVRLEFSDRTKGSKIPIETKDQELTTIMQHQK